ncbi:uncharacterized protein LOC114293803 isoform X2 [Camellia sinensis]|uniref:uncharacterized protein LOC114293803 isoform X2 n=1 Tax=Camellia sinensis TaxID=4442 RepID=UPI0010363FC6|nr:uncharacterized protein LOC114293803 isoform X2 [Camellia sinensis]
MCVCLGLNLVFHFSLTGDSFLSLTHSLYPCLPPFPPPPIFFTRHQSPLSASLSLSPPFTPPIYFFLYHRGLQRRSRHHRGLQRRSRYHRLQLLHCCPFFSQFRALLEKAPSQGRIADPNIMKCTLKVLPWDKQSPLKSRLSKQTKRSLSPKKRSSLNRLAQVQTLTA